MAVLVAIPVEDGSAVIRYTPYHAGRRGGVLGSDPVGTLMINAEAVGAAGGGSVTVNITMLREAFGFPLMFVPTIVVMSDNLASAEDSTLTFDSPRFVTALSQVVTKLSTTNVGNMGQVPNVAVNLEGDATPRTIIQGVWDTNTDTKVYHIHAFGPVYDMQVIAARGYISDIIAGIR